jgi:hypothetical protein
MWSLPDIERLNREASSQKSKIERALRTGKLGGKKIRCEHNNDNCRGEVFLEPWYDIFSADPKGTIRGESRKR